MGPTKGLSDKSHSLSSSSTDIFNNHGFWVRAVFYACEFYSPPRTRIANISVHGDGNDYRGSATPTRPPMRRWPRARGLAGTSTDNVPPDGGFVNRNNFGPSETALSCSTDTQLCRTTRELKAPRRTPSSSKQLPPPTCHPMHATHCGACVRDLTSVRSMTSFIVACFGSLLTLPTTDGRGVLARALELMSPHRQVCPHARVGSIAPNATRCAHRHRDRRTGTSHEAQSSMPVCSARVSITFRI